MAAPRMQLLSRIGCPVLPVRGASQGPWLVRGARTRCRGIARAQKQEPDAWASWAGRSAAAAGLVLLSLIDVGPYVRPGRANEAAFPLLETQLPALEDVAEAKEDEVGASVEEGLEGNEEEGAAAGEAEVGEQVDPGPAPEAGTGPALEAADAGQEQVYSASAGDATDTFETVPVEAQGSSGTPLTATELEEVRSPAVEASVPGVSLEAVLLVGPELTADDSGPDAAPGPEPEGAQALSLQEDESSAPPPAASGESNSAQGTKTLSPAALDSKPALTLPAETLSPDASAEASGQGTGQAAVAVAVSALGAAVLAVSRLLGLSAKQDELKDDLIRAERQVKEGRRLLLDMQALVLAQAQEAETAVTTLRTSSSGQAATLKGQLHETQALLKSVEAELSATSAKGERMQVKIEEQEESISQLKRQLEERSLTIASLGAEMQEQNMELVKVEQALAQAQQEAEARAQSLDDAEQVRANLEQKLQEQLRLAQAGPEQVVELEKQLEAERQAAASEKQAVEQRLVELERAYDAELTAKVTLEKQVAAQAQQLSAADERIRSLLARVTRMEEELAAKEVERAAMASRLKEEESQSAA